MNTRAVLYSSIALFAVGCTVGSGAAPPGGEPPDNGGVLIRRLSRLQVQNSVKEFFSGLTAARRDQLLSSMKLRLELIPIDSAEGFAQNDTSLGADHVEAVQGLAMAIMANIAPYAADLTAMCNGKTLDDDGCLTAFVQRYGRKAFRRPLTQTEVDDFKAFYKSAVATAGPDPLGVLLGGMIAHPNFYYRFDNEGEALSGTEGQDAIYRLSKWELLSKVTFLFWMAPPTDALYDRVETTDITVDDNLRLLVEDVLKDPRADAGITEFFREWLALDRTVTPVSTGNTVAGYYLVQTSGIVQVPSTHVQDEIQEVLDLATYYSITTDGKLDDILTSPYSFARTSALAQIYGVPVWDGSPERLVRFPEGQRSGLLSRAAMITSNFEFTRPILKGKAVQEHVLCMAAPPPPPNLELVPVLYVPDKTTRQSTEVATASVDCQGCHTTLNALGFATEHYDSLGRFRAKETMFGPNASDAQGRQTATVASQLDINSTVTVMLPSGKSQTVADAIELGAFIAQSGDAHACMAKGFFAYGVKEKLVDDADTIGLQTLTSTLKDKSIKEMLRQAALLQSFRQRKVK